MEQINHQYQIKRPSDVFGICPACEGQNMFAFEGEAFCQHCDWNSVNVSAECSRGWSSIAPIDSNLRMTNRLQGDSKLNSQPNREGK